uniref:Uncharacterized protein n=1 Tax=Arundo donax TaxID=35708 RepID=A0A0A9TB22_ARUDO
MFLDYCITVLQFIFTLTGDGTRQINTNLWPACSVIRIIIVYATVDVSS